MAKIEEVTESSADERWQAQRRAQKLDVEIQQLKVALSELDTVKPKKTTHYKKANVFFLDRRDVIVKSKRNELKEKERLRYDLGLKLRESSA